MSQGGSSSANPGVRSLRTDGVHSCTANTPTRGIFRSAHCSPHLPSDGLSRGAQCGPHWPSDRPSRGSQSCLCTHIVGAFCDGGSGGGGGSSWSSLQSVFLTLGSNASGLAVVDSTAPPVGSTLVEPSVGASAPSAFASNDALPGSYASMTSHSIGSVPVMIFHYFSFLFPSHDRGNPDSYLPSLYGRVELHNIVYSPTSASLPTYL
jgi:hypothetical protein